MREIPEEVLKEHQVYREYAFSFRSVTKPECADCPELEIKVHEFTICVMRELVIPNWRKTKIKSLDGRREHNVLNEAQDQLAAQLSDCPGLRVVDANPDEYAERMSHHPDLMRDEKAVWILSDVFPITEECGLIQPTSAE